MAELALLYEIGKASFATTSQTCYPKLNHAESHHPHSAFRNLHSAFRIPQSAI
ncbi:MAG: hypothetical protein QME81_06285 [bacterium]|nr:hypothetical protein [bacterium]